jgi:hypothetical protein
MVTAMPSEFERQTLRVGLDLEADAEPIRGQLRDSRGGTQPFTGWLELIQLLDRARAGHAVETGEDQETT